METVFIKIFNMSIAAGWLILAVIVLRFLLQKAPKWLACTLWAVVAVRLICPFTFESAFSLIPSAETVRPDVVRYAPEPSIDSGIPAIDGMLNPMISETFAPAPGASVNPLDIWAFAASIIWVIGLVAMLGYAFVSFLRLRGMIREAVPLQNHVWVCDAVKSPFILGVVRPRIYLSSSMNAEQTKYVLAHERAHLKRGDHVWKPFGYVLLAVYWFHPLVWAAYSLFCRDIELACDERAVKNISLDDKKAYCRALLSYSMPGGMRVSYPLAFGEGRVKERVKHVLHYRRPAFWVVLGAAGMCLVVAVCFLTNPETDTSVETTGVPYDDMSETTNVPHDNEFEKSNAQYNAGVESADTSNQFVSTDTLYDEGETITFTGVIVENTTDSVKPLILVQPIGDELPYPRIFFVLPDDETDWTTRINSIVSVTCKDSFEETDPAIGELISISLAESAPDPQDMFSTFGISIDLPGNSNWIQNIAYSQPDADHMEIDYHDAIIDADCKLLAVRDGMPDLPDIVYDKTLTETWQGTFSSGQTVYIKVQRSADGTQVLASWEYEEYQFALLADVPVKTGDIGAIAKTAITVISNLK
ncbi:MAG: M56 family metallopeptidase [Lachnospiraceae bacterium]|nr:M56 family metallopeptidase [Lachnospiraceae bacterium]